MYPSVDGRAVHPDFSLNTTKMRGGDGGWPTLDPGKGSLWSAVTYSYAVEFCVISTDETQTRKLFYYDSVTICSKISILKDTKHE